jgi:RNA polymerase sigma-70 factor (sigma-E family)
MTRDADTEAAFTEFAVASRARLRNTAYLLCGDWERASDHVQEALIRVYVAWPRLRRHGRELGYARKAVVSVFLDAARRRSSSEQPLASPPDRPSGEDLARGVSDRAALMTALADLPERQRACVVLRYFEDLDVRETAAALGCSEGTVKSQTSRGLASLRVMLEDPAPQGASRDESVATGEEKLAW